MSYLASLDQGTTSCRAVIFDEKLNMISSAQKEFTQIYPQPGWVEHNANEIYATQMGVLKEAMIIAGITGQDLKGIGITNQRETTVLWDKNTGKPISNAIVWQCRRTADYCERLKEEGYTDYILQNTGLVIDAYFSGTKISWLLDHIPDARERAERGEILFGTMDSFLVWKMTKGSVHITDYTNASRTMLYNIRTLCWDDALCSVMNIPKLLLPKVVGSSEIYGYVDLDGYNVPIAGIAGDQQAALFGQGCFSPGEGKNTYGTGCFLLMNTGKDLYISNSGLVSTIAIGLDGEVQYALEGSIFVAGAVIQWLRDQLGMIETAAESEIIAGQIAQNDGVYFVPAFTGLGAPYWDMYAKGTLCGLTRGSTKAHIVRAALESIAYQSLDVIKAMEQDTQIPLKQLKVDGGASVNGLLMQFQADLIQGEVICAKNKETTALGAAALAGLGAGVFKDKEELYQLIGQGSSYHPQKDLFWQQQQYTGWKEAVAKTLKH